MCVNVCEVRFQLDFGADVNAISQKFLNKSQVSETHVSETDYVVQIKGYSLRTNYFGNLEP